MTATAAWLAAVEAMLNRGIGASSQATALARRLNGTALQIDVVGMTSIRVSTSGGRLALIAADVPGQSRPTAPVDATIGGSPYALLKLARASGAERSPSPSRRTDAPGAAVSGDAEVANSYRHLAVLARPDLEEELSRLVGDLPARRLSLFAEKAVRWARHVGRTAGENIAEYWQEESRDLVNKTELDEFLQGVDTLREATDRIEARLTQIDRIMKDRG